MQSCNNCLFYTHRCVISSLVVDTYDAETYKLWVDKIADGIEKEHNCCFYRRKGFQ